MKDWLYRREKDGREVEREKKENVVRRNIIITRIDFNPCYHRLFCLLKIFQTSKTVKWQGLLPFCLLRM
jgi:hypothetical protein